MGGGPVGAELAQFFSRMGSQVTIVERGERLLGRVHPDAGELLAKLFREEGIDVRLGVGVERVEPGVTLHLSDGSTLEAERLLVATGRRPNVERLGLERVGVEISQRGVEVDERLRARRRQRLGDRRHDRHRAVHARRQVPGAGGGGGHRASATPRPTTAPSRPGCSRIRRSRPSAAPTATGSSARGSSSGRCRASRRTSGRSATGFIRVFADPRQRVLVGAVCVGPAGRGVAGAVHARDPGRGPGRDAPRHDPAVPDLLRGRLLRLAGVAGLGSRRFPRCSARSSPRS